MSDRVVLKGMVQAAAANNLALAASARTQARMARMGFDSAAKTKAILEGSLTSIAAVEADTVSSVRAYALAGCDKLTSSLSFPAALSVGSLAFYGCSLVPSIDLPKAVSVGARAFLNCLSITSVSLPDATTVGECCFSGCTGVTSASLPKVISVEAYTFQGCTALTSVILTEATSIDDTAFEGCTAIQTFSAPLVKSLRLASPALVAGGLDDCASLTSLTLEGMTSLPSKLLYNLSALEDLTLTDLAEATRADFLYVSKTLQNVNLPSIAEIPEQAFGRLNTTTSAFPSLQTVSADEATSIGATSFWLCTALTSVSFVKAATISSNAFYKCDKLSSIAIPSVETIGMRAFYGCVGIATLSIPNAKRLSSYCFMGCTGLTDLDTSSVESISNNVFDGCSSIPKLSFPSIAVEYESASIGGDAFANCPLLMDLTLGCTLAEAQASTGYPWGLTSGCVITCSDGSITV